MAVSLLEARRQILLNTPHIESASGSIATFNTDLSTNLKECKIHFYPVQEGTGDPSPDNVRPITGWDGLTVTRTGINIFDGEMENGDINENTGANSGTSSSRCRCKNYIRYNGGNPFYFLSPERSGNFRLFFYDENKTYLGYGSYPINTVLNPNKGYSDKIRYMRFRFGTGRIEGDENISVNVDTTYTTHLPYTAIEIPISFGRTIYGGYVDLIKGEVVEEWKSFTADGTESSYPQNSLQRFTVPTDTVNKNLLYERTNPNHLVCDRLLNTAANGMGNPEYRVAILSNQYLQMKITADINTPELFREWLVNNNVQTVCELATPNTYTLTPQNIKALKGINNIWSDANGDIEVKFWKH